MCDTHVRALLLFSPLPRTIRTIRMFFFLVNCYGGYVRHEFASLSNDVALDEHFLFCFMRLSSFFLSFCWIVGCNNSVEDFVVCAMHMRGLDVRPRARIEFLSLCAVLY